jgi:hypothetical protein
MKKYAFFTIVALFAVLTSAVMADAVITTSKISGDTYLGNQTFVIRVEITSNDTGQMPESYALRVSYNTNSCTYQSVADGSGFSFGPLASSEEGTPPNVTRDINGDYIGNTDSTPILMEITFQTTATPGTFTITVADDPGNDPLLDDLITAIAHSYDNSATTGLPVELDWMEVE